MNAHQQCQKILETYGGKIADKAATLLLQDPALQEISPMLEFVSKNWRDPLRPAMIKLACEAVEGKPEDTEEVALAMSLMNLSYYLWDDIVDKAPCRLFKPTLFGKFGEGPALITGGLATAKAFAILNQCKFEKTTRQAITGLFWGMWIKMANAEVANLKARNNKYAAKDKLQKIEAEAAASLETCLRLGATIGNASKKEIEHLSKYGLYIGILLELQQDFRVSINQTLELVDKIRTGALPYALLWAKEHSQQLQKDLNEVANKQIIHPVDVEKIVNGILTTKVTDEIYDRIVDFTEKAIDELKIIKKKRAFKELYSFAKAQPKLFKESCLFSEIRGR